MFACDNSRNSILLSKKYLETCQLLRYVLKARTERANKVKNNEKKNKFTIDLVSDKMVLLLQVMCNI